jgi:hypothetical protein
MYDWNERYLGIEPCRWEDWQWMALISLSSTQTLRVNELRRVLKLRHTRLLPSPVQENDVLGLYLLANHVIVLCSLGVSLRGHSRVFPWFFPSSQVQVAPITGSTANNGSARHDARMTRNTSPLPNQA